MRTDVREANLRGALQAGEDNKKREGGGDDDRMLVNQWDRTPAFCF